jgi:DNA-binding NtrC family response regulator
MSRGNLLLVDDDRLLLRSMAAWLRELDFEVQEAQSVQESIRHLGQHSYDLLLVDIRLEDGDGFQVLEHCRRQCPETTVILMTGYGTVETGVEALRAGAFDLLTKPLIDDELELAIQRALSQRQVLEENQQLKAQLDLRFGMENIIGHDYRMQRIFDIIDSVADTRATVLVTGESGTGKSLLARAIHRRSTRRDRPFVEVACGALPETLLESELFGHVAGAFTGAIGDKKGKFMLADGGTIFLDEIGTSTPGLQVKLLRVLQELEFEPVGGNSTQRVDVRVILATNEDLTERVSNGTFRQDLYYRINVINVEIPPLRQRVSDIPLLARHFLLRACEDSGKPLREFSEDALAAMQQYHWPGNVRELQNVVERSVLLGKGDLLTRTDLPTNVNAASPRGTVASSGRTLKEALEEPERQIILEVLQASNWNRNLTADRLGINRTTLYKKMRRLGLEDPRCLPPLND